MHSVVVQPRRGIALTKEEFQDLKLLDSCAVADAIERFRTQLRHDSYAEAGLTCRHPDMLPVLGYAVTLKVRSSLSPGTSESFLESSDWWDALLAIPSPRIVVIQDMDRFAGATAVLNEASACVLKTLDCVGAVTNGAVQGVQKIEGLDFQVFSGSLSLSYPRHRIVQVAGTVQIGCLEINPGDLIHGDRHGIVRIPGELATRIPATARALRKSDEEIMSYCQSSEFTVDGLRELLSEQ